MLKIAVSVLIALIVYDLVVKKMVEKTKSTFESETE